MPQLDTGHLSTVESVMNYLDFTGERPAYWLYETEPGYTPPPPGTDKHSVPIHDLRTRMDEVSLDENGFAFVREPLPDLDFLDAAAVAAGYYGRCEALVQAATGATRVLAFDHNVRDKALSEQPDSGIRDPVRFVHNDYTEASAPQRVHDLMGDEADALLQHRYVFINVWRPLRGPVQDVPLGILDAGSLQADDFVATDLRYRDRTGEIYTVRYSPRHRWFFLRGMHADEVLLLKCFDSAADGRARYTAHSAFRDQGAPADALPRRSIEVRTIAFFGPAPA